MPSGALSESCSCSQLLIGPCSTLGITIIKLKAKLCVLMEQILDWENDWCIAYTRLPHTMSQMSEQVKSVTFGTTQHSIWFKAMSAFLLPKDLLCMCVCLSSWAQGFVFVKCWFYMMCPYVCDCILFPVGKLSDVKSQGHVTGQHLCLQQGRCLLSHRRKPWSSIFLLAQLLCCACRLCVTAYTPVLYTHPHLPPAPLHNLPGGIFTLTAALALWGSVTTGQVQAEIRTGFISLLNTFLLKGNCNTKEETGRTVGLNLMELIVALLMNRS